MGYLRDEAQFATGWIPADETWTYSSVDGPTGVITIPAGGASKYGVGMRVKLTQTTVKYFIVTAVSDTTLTIYGGTDYALTSAAISANYYSLMKAPLGMPMDPNKWTVQVTDTTGRSQGSPTGGTWYNLGGVSISIPIGVWDVEYSVHAYTTRAATIELQLLVTLSTANNSASDTQLTASGRSAILASVSVYEFHAHRHKTLVLASKTAYYLNTLTGTASTASINNLNDEKPCIIRARCAYL